MDSSMFCGVIDEPAENLLQTTSKNRKTSASVWLFFVGVSKNKGNPPKWMVKTMENPIF